MFRWIATFILLWFIFQVRHVFPPIIVGGIIAYLVLPVVQALSQKTKLPLGISTAIVYITLLLVIVGAGFFIGPSIMKEIAELSVPENQHKLVHRAVEQLAGLTRLQTDTDQLSDQILSGIASSISRPEQLKEVGESISHLLLNILVCVVSSIYFTLDSQSVARFFLRYVPEGRRTGVIDLFGQMNRMLSKYVQGQILLIIIMSTFTWLALAFVFHMKYALPVAVFSGFLEIIPVLGPIVATTTATLVGLSQFEPQTVLFIILFYMLARWGEDYVVVPKIIGHAVELHPLAVIFAVLCGETLAGGLGMLIAIPVAACIKLVLDYFYTGQLPADRRPDKRKKHHYGEKQGAGTRSPVNGGAGSGSTGSDSGPSASSTGGSTGSDTGPTAAGTESSATKPVDGAGSDAGP